VRYTQRAIKQALTERYYQWREAEELAKEDNEIDLSGEGPAYIPGNFVEDIVVEEASDKQADKPSS
jgi:large subunit ribosomal protein L47